MSNYAASGATPEFPATPPGLWSGSLQSLTFFIELHVLSINLSNEVNFIREKSSLQAGIGASFLPIPTALAVPSKLQCKKIIRKERKKMYKKSKCLIVCESVCHIKPIVSYGKMKYLPFLREKVITYPRHMKIVIRVQFP